MLRESVPHQPKQAVSQLDQSATGDSNLFANLELPVGQPELPLPVLDEVQGLSWRDLRTPGKEVRMEAAECTIQRFGLQREYLSTGQPRIQLARSNMGDPRPRTPTESVSSTHIRGNAEDRICRGCLSLVGGPFSE